MKKQCFTRRYGAAAAILAGALFLTGCGASKSSSAYMAETTAASYDNKAEVYQETAAMEYDQVSPEDGGLTSSTGNLNVQPASRKLIRNANMDVETSDFDGLLETISSQITALGGYTQDSSVTGSSMTGNNEPRRRYASITARIPQEKLDSFITTVEQNGNITNRYESTSDVTLQYSDLESRKKSLIVEQDRIGMLKSGSWTGYHLKRLSSSCWNHGVPAETVRTTKWDSTVSLSIQEVTTTPPHRDLRPGSERHPNADAMTAFMTGFLIWLITTSPIWLPLALIVLVILFFTRRRRGRERIKKAAQSAPSDIIDRTTDISDTEEDVYYTEDK
ncbi:MAG: DUF4349 domain-containing protein [Hungatella hathewayi]